MEQYPFIFSNERRYRVSRHLAFWLGWWLFSSILYSFSAGMLGTTYFKRLPVSMVEAAAFLVTHLFLSYALMYWVLPKFLLKGKYVQTVIVVLLLILSAGSLSALTGIYVVGGLRYWLLGHTNQPEHLNEFGFFYGLLAGLRGGITIAGMAASIKLMKYWYVKEQRNLQLQKENISAQLQLLKAQVHPHFLFNTLNNIYATAQVASPATAGMIMSLSGLLRYMLHDGSQAVVPLGKELKMLTEYIQLEQVRYGNELEVHTSFPDHDMGLVIAPLILLPFVENCFKHGTSKMLEQPWMHLDLRLEESWLKMRLINGKAPEPVAEPSGLGLTNVRQRLQWLYPDRHELVITDEAEVFIVNLKLRLDQAPPGAITVKQPTLTAYA